MQLQMVRHLMELHIHGSSVDRIIMAKSQPSYNADLVWSASAYAFRMNPDEYVRHIKTEVLDTENYSNRDTMMLAINDTSLITDQDRELGNKMRKHFQAYTFKIMKGEKLNEFKNNAMLFANRDIITSSFELGSIAYFPYVYDQDTKKSQIENRIIFAKGGYVGIVGKKVLLDIEVLKSVYSTKWSTYYVKGITENENVVFFPFKETLLESGLKLKIEGKIKEHKDNMTHLNRVKVV